MKQCYALLLFLTFSLLVTYCGKPAATFNSVTTVVRQDSVAGPKSSKQFSWNAAFVRKTWTDIVRDWYDGEIDSVFASCMYDSFALKIQTAQHFSAQMKAYGLPESSIFFEYVDWDALGIQQDRALALWIENPEILVNYDGLDFGCSSAITGLGQVLGNASLLLLDTRKKRILQRLDSIPENYSRSFDTPFAIEHTGVYHCSNPIQNEDYSAWGLATVLFPRDLDGDGIAAEFTFYNYEACGVYSCAIVAYDPKADRLETRPFQLKITGATFNAQDQLIDTFYTENTYWVLDFPLDSVRQDGQIKYIKDVGHGNAFLYHYDFKFDPKTRSYRGTMKEKGIID